MQCSKCLIESNRYGPESDSSGVCSYCRIVDKFSNVISQIGKQEQLLQERLSLFRNIRQYDCIVGLSGGKDSSYIMYKLKSYYGARCLAFTCDNGFLTDYAKKNIDGIVREFDIEHIWIRPSTHLLQALYSKNLALECWPCSACVHMGEASIWKLAYEKKIPFIISGRTPEQIFRRPDMECFESPLSLIANNFAPYDKKRVHKLAVNMLQRIENEKKWLLPDQRLWADASDQIYLKSSFSIPDDFAPEYLSFFFYEEHDELKMMDILERETSWRWGLEKDAQFSHHDCAAHDAAGYLYNRMIGVPFLSLETSASIRHNKISQEEGRKIVEKELERLSVFPRDSILSLSEVSGIHPFSIRLLPSRIKAIRYLKNKIKRILLKVRLWDFLKKILIRMIKKEHL